MLLEIWTEYSSACILARWSQTVTLALNLLGFYRILNLGQLQKQVCQLPFKLQGFILYAESSFFFFFQPWIHPKALRITQFIVFGSCWQSEWEVSSDKLFNKTLVLAVNGIIPMPLIPSEWTGITHSFSLDFHFTALKRQISGSRSLLNIILIVCIHSLFCVGF